MGFFSGQDRIAVCVKQHVKYVQIEERHIMKMKRKLHKWRIKEINKINSKLYTSRCTARKEKTLLRYIFFNGAKFV